MGRSSKLNSYRVCLTKGKTMSLVLLSPPSPTMNASLGWNCHWLGTDAISSWKITGERYVAWVPASSGSLRNSSSRMHLALAITASPLPRPGLSSELQGMAGKCRSLFPLPLNLNDMGASSSPIYSPHAPSPTQGMFYAHSSNLAWYDITSHSRTIKFNTLILPNNTLLDLVYLHISLSFLVSPSEPTSSGHQGLCNLLQTWQACSNFRGFACSVP